MCGITGFLSKKFSEKKPLEMTTELKHRGPDALGYFYNQQNGTALGHREVKHIRSCENANQPMSSHCRRYIMVYNGEVYNFKEIARN